MKLNVRLSLLRVSWCPVNLLGWSFTDVYLSNNGNCWKKSILYERKSSTDSRAIYLHRTLHDKPFREQVPYYFLTKDKIKTLSKVRCKGGV